MSRGNTSSQSRVQPVFDALYRSDPTGGWISKLVALPRRSSPRAGGPIDPGPLREHAWDPRERALPAPRALLLHLARSGSALRPRPGRARTGGETEALRDKLVADDAATIDAAVQLLSRGAIPARDWYIFEGPTKPDVYLRTDRVVIVIEGKNEEPKHTTRTDWMEVRYQMLRHIDGAWPQVPGDPPVLGFYIVEAESGSTTAPEKWLRFSDETVSGRALDGSLPHRSPAERRAMASSFLGVTTWQAVCASLDLPLTLLP